MFNIKQNEAENIVITISGYDLIHALTLENKILLIESLSCSDDVIKHILDVLTDDYTVTGFTTKNRNKHRSMFLENADLIQKALFESLQKSWYALT